MIRNHNGKLYVSEDYFKLLMSTRGYDSFIHYFISVTYVRVPELSVDELFCDIDSIQPEDVRERIRSDIQSIGARYAVYSVKGGETHG